MRDPRGARRHGEQLQALGPARTATGSAGWTGQLNLLTPWVREIARTNRSTGILQQVRGGSKVRKAPNIPPDGLKSKRDLFPSPLGSAPPIGVDSSSVSGVAADGGRAVLVTGRGERGPRGGLCSVHRPAPCTAQPYPPLEP
ncbi:predicted protein [Streptomyces sp. C]|nr:predicted protein [Streptomyces sp. C]